MWLNLDDAQYICERLDFPDCRIVLRVDREIRAPDGKILFAESRYFATSLDPASVTSSRLQSYVRDHWQVEILGAGFYRGWFQLSTDTVNQKSSATITVDKDKIHEDEQTAKDKVHGFGQEAKDKVGDPAGKAK